MNVLFKLVPAQYRGLALVFLGVAIIAGYVAWANHQQAIGEARATAKYNTAIDKQKLEASAVLAMETAKTVAIEKKLQDFKNSQEIKDANNKKTTDMLTARLHSLVDSRGRLRDPNAAAGCGPGGNSSTSQASPGPGNRPDNGTDAAGVLSAELSGLLQRLNREADRINLAYISCRADAEAVRAP